MKVADLFEEPKPELTDAEKRKKKLKRRAELDHQKFLQKRDFVLNVNDLKAKLPKEVINLADVHTPHTDLGTVGRPHGKVR